MPFKEMSQELIRTLRPVIEAKLNAEFKEQGINFRLGRCTFDARSAEFKMTVDLKEAGDVNAKFAEEWNRRAARLGLDVKWLNQTFRHSARTSYKIVGLNDRPTNCVVIEDVRTRKQKICSPQMICSVMEFTRPTVIPGAVSHAEIERRIAEMKAHAPENYYADGEFQAAGMTEKQIHAHHYRQIERELRSGSSLPPMNLFQTKK